MIEVYCDESAPDSLTSDSPLSDQLFLGSLWLDGTSRRKLKRDIQYLKDVHSFNQELKWNRITPRHVDLYKSLIDLYFSYGDKVWFRAISVPVKRVRYDFNNDREHRFFVFYRELLKAWIQSSNEEYQIFLDAKTLRERGRPAFLEEQLRAARPGAQILQIQSADSSDSLCIQLCDVLLGCVQARLNNKMDYRERSAAKREVVEHLELRLGRQVSSTGPGERKLNVFKMHLFGS